MLGFSKGVFGIVAPVMNWPGIFEIVFPVWSRRPPPNGFVLC